MENETARAYDAEPERELIRLLREEGASDVFITLLKTDAQAIGVERNSVRREVNKWINWNDGEISQEALKPSYGGGFFTKMWDGDLYRAYQHADLNNQALLVETFGINYINRQRPAGTSEVTA